MACKPLARYRQDMSWYEGDHGDKTDLFLGYKVWYIGKDVI